MKHFDLNTFLTDLSHNLNNLNPEAGEVNTFSDKFVKVFNDTLDKHAPYRYASRKEQRSCDWVIELCSVRLIDGVSSHNAFAFYLDYTKLGISALLRSSAVTSVTC